MNDLEKTWMKEDEEGSAGVPIVAKTLKEIFSEYKTAGGFELNFKLKKNLSVNKDAIEFSIEFTEAYREFKNRFNYIADGEAKAFILHFQVLCKELSRMNMEYGGGDSLGDYMTEMEIKRTLSENLFDIDDFFRMYGEIQSSGKSSIQEALKKLSEEDDDGENKSGD